MAKLARIAVIGKDCVACGCCAGVCPVGAVTIYKGLYALVDNACIGCGKCAKNCPAAVITMASREAKSA